jgi:hypothetical protein
MYPAWNYKNSCEFYQTKTHHSFSSYLRLTNYFVTYCQDSVKAAAVISLPVITGKFNYATF